MIILDLIYNLSLLVTLCILSGILDDHYDLKYKKGLILQGLLFGGIAVIGMMQPFEFDDGIIIDGRSIVISLGTLFFGPLTGGIASLIAGIFRISIGGAGAAIGVLVISTSYVTGWIFHILYNRYTPHRITKIRLYLFGVLVHAMMVFFISTMPGLDQKEILATVGVSILVIFPVVTVIIGKIFQDQIERKESFRKLADSENKFQLLVKSTDDMVYTLDREHHFTGIFGMWMLKYGIDKFFFYGKTTSDLLGKKAGSYHDNKIDEALTGKPVVFEWELDKVGSHSVIDVSGQKTWYQTKLSPIRDVSGSVIGLVGIGRNISELKKAQDEIARSLKEKNVLLAEIHHRVKNNMAIISSLLTLQSDYARDPDTRALFLDNETRVRSMALVHEIVYERTNFAEIKMKELLDRLGLLITESYNLETQNIALHIESDDINLEIKTSIPCALLVNELISNAYKHAFNGEDGGLISVKFKRLNGKVKLSVTDNGRGVEDPSKLNKPASFGYTIVHGLVQQLRGDIRFEHPGKGLCVVVTF